MGEFTHKILLFTDAMQRIPVWAMIAVFIGAAALVIGCWPAAPWLGLVYYLAAQFGHVSLLLLPVFDVSHGPDRASALGLAALLALPVMALGWLGGPPWLAVAWLVGISALAVYAAWVEPFRVQVNRQRKSVPGWDPAHPLVIAHMSDLHAEHFGRREKIVNRLLRQIKPDVIVFSGDFVNLSYVHDPKVRAAVREIISHWHAPLGVYAVSGTSPEVDLPEDVPYFVGEVENAQSLVGRWASVAAPGGVLHIGGLPSWHVMETERAALNELLRTRPAGGAQVLLVHTPDLAPEAAEAGFHLYLCGHTHGGQLCLPGGVPIVTASFLGRRFMRGRVDVGQTTIYTTRGLGFEGLGAPRARLFCRPEITLWEITA